MKLYFKEERDTDFLSSYKAVIKKYGQNAPFLKKEFLLSEAIQRPAKRFYVSEEQAFRVVSNMLKGKKVSLRNTLKKLMYEEIFTAVKTEMEISAKPLQDIVQQVVNQQAPRFYLTLESAQILYYKLIKSNHR